MNTENKLPLMPDDPYLIELRKTLGPMDESMDPTKQFLLLAGERDALLSARTKDRELIQMAVDEFRHLLTLRQNDIRAMDIPPVIKQHLMTNGATCKFYINFLTAAKAAGYTPKLP